MAKFNRSICLLIIEVIMVITLGHYLFEYVNSWLGFTTYIIGIYLIIKSIINLIKERRNETD